MTARTATADSNDCGSSSLLRTLLLCDLVDSTGLVERLGDRAGAELIRKHDRLARTIADRHCGRETASPISVSAFAGLPSNRVRKSSSFASFLLRRKRVALAQCGNWHGISACV